MPPQITSTAPTNNRREFFFFLGLITIILGVLFARSFDPDLVVFSNDGPLGANSSACVQAPACFSGIWTDLNSIGGSGGAAVPNFTNVFAWLLGPVYFGKFFAPFALFIAGLGAWTFFKALNLSPLAAMLGALAAMLNPTFFSAACWGVGPQEIALGMNFFALALVVANNAKTPWFIRWLRLALAGLCVGINVAESFDIGALYSLFVAAFVFYKAITDNSESTLKKFSNGITQVAMVSVFAGFIAFQTVTSLVTTQIQGVAGTAQDAQTKLQHWDFATQWSLPKKETVGLLVPGLFGYKMDTPKDMMPQLQSAYQGGVYWGGMGRSPEIDRFLDSGRKGDMPQGMMRFSGGGNYCGILVWLIAAWTIAQSFRKKTSPFPGAQRRMIWFWAFVLIICLPLAWGRFAPFSETSDGFMFYALLYKLPYFSTIRNPAKFISFLCWAIVILFAYGVHALSQRHLAGAAVKSSSLSTQLTNWWAQVGGFDRRWTLVCAGILGGSILGWLIFSGEKTNLAGYLQKMGFPDESLANEIAAFSINQAGWFVWLLAAAIILMTVTIAGYFSGSRARIGSALLMTFLVFDLGRANLPYIIHWDYKQKYEVATLNPIVEFLRKQPYEHRVAGLPFRAPEGMELLDQLYRIEWMQHQFPYYNIQCLDIIQMPRMPEDLKTYLEALSPRGTAESAPLIARRWELSNTRYLLGAAGYLDVMNQQLDPVQKRFRILQRFEIVPKPGILQPTRLEELTAVPNENGRYALFEFTGALPRVKLYSNWQVNTNDQANLKTLADLKFDPEKTVLISTIQNDLPVVATNENSGTVDFKSYSPKQIVFAASATKPSVLLLNDKFDPNWHVTVDGKPVELLRCDFLMRGIYLMPGPHTVEFNFSLPNKPLYITLAALVLGIFLSGILAFLTKKCKLPAPI